MGNRSHSSKYRRGCKQGQWPVYGQTTLYPAYAWTTSYSRVGSDNPKYAQKVSDMLDATNYLKIESKNVYFQPGFMSGVYHGTLWPQIKGTVIETTFFDNFAPGPISTLPPLPFRQTVSNNALLGIIKKIRKDQTSGFGGPTFLGELRETVSMIKSPLKALRTKTGLFTNLHMRVLRDKQAKGKRFKPDSWADVVSDTYLEWQYGAKPLIGDIGEICQLSLDKLQRVGSQKSGLKRLSFIHKDVMFESLPSSAPLAWAGTGFSASYNVCKHMQASTLYVAWLESDIGFAETNLEWLVRAAKFDVGEIVPTMWELLPFSFLVDYFTNIGDVLGCTFDYNAMVRFVKRTDKYVTTEFNSNFVAKTAEPRQYSVVGFEPPTYTSQYTFIERSAAGTLGIPQFDISLPSLGQASNILALMISLRDNNPFRGHTLK